MSLISQWRFANAARTKSAESDVQESKEDVQGAGENDLVYGARRRDGPLRPQDAHSSTKKMAGNIPTAAEEMPPQSRTSAREVHGASVAHAMNNDGDAMPDTAAFQLLTASIDQLQEEVATQKFLDLKRKIDSIAIDIKDRNKDFEDRVRELERWKERAHGITLLLTLVAGAAGAVVSKLIFAHG